MTKVNAQGFTDEEQAELDQADKEIEEQAATTDSAAKQEAQPVEEQEPPVEEEKTSTAAPQTMERAKPPAGYVPQQALHEIRKELQEEREKRAKMEGAWQTIQQRLNAPTQQQSAPQGEIPDFEKDPIGNLRALNTQLMEQVKTLSGQHQQTVQQQQQQAIYHDTMNR